MSKAERLFGVLIVILFILFLSPLILSMAFYASPVILPPSSTDIFVLFWGYRWYDMIFLALVIIAAIAGLSSLFRVEKPETHVEETVIEGHIKEEIEEEE
jgi:membrane protein implicated in regulation of membrane protease activity